MADLYHYEDVQEILSRAIARQAHTDDLSRGQLLEIAAELGIAPEALQLAEREWFSQKGELQERQVFNVQRRQDFQHHLVKFAIVNAFLVLLNVAALGTITWALYPILGWGLGLSLHGWNAYHTGGKKYETEFQKWRRRRQIKHSINKLLNRWLSV